jgi:spore coat protein H
MRTRDARGRLVPQSLPVAAALFLGLAACREPLDPAAANADWTTASHGVTAPDYAVVFPQDSVNRLDITMSAEQWAGLRQDVSQLLGFDFGTRVGSGCCAYIVGEPKYVDVTLRFRGKTWKHVGFRLKGAASLQSSWGDGNYKLPFRLKFDAFDDQFPETWHQRIYGFRELSAAPAIWDHSLIRDKMASDVFRLAGVPAARTAFYRVYIDIGSGPQYRGLYTVMELPENTLLRDQFGEERGNLYKPVTTFQSFSPGAFPKQNNEASSYADVQAFVSALNSPLRLADVTRWRTELEATFDVDHFLKWLAINNAIVSWDTYGANGHNFYLYNHSRRRLVWIPWDNNFAFAGEPGITGEFPRTNISTGLSLTMNEVDARWPLIRYLIDDPTYSARYRLHLRTFMDSVFTQDRMNARIEKYHAMIAPWVTGPNGERPESTHLPGSDAFTSSLPQLRAHVAARRALIAEFLR